VHLRIARLPGSADRSPAIVKRAQELRPTVTGSSLEGEITMTALETAGSPATRSRCV
jgi:hypothetical protein